MSRFWTDPKNSPKLAFQWYMEFGSGPIRDLENNIVPDTPNTTDIVQSYTLRSFQRPSMGFTVSQYKVLNTPNYIADDYRWNPIEVVLIDGQGARENNASKLYNMLLKSGISPDIDPSEVSDIIKEQQIAAVGGRVRFRQINADGDTIERWTLIGPVISYHHQKIHRN